METKQILLVANDVAPSSIFEKLERELPAHLGESVNIKTLIFLHKNNEEISEALARKILESDFVLIGMSSALELAKYEILAAHMAKKLSVPFGFFADTFNTFALSWFSSFMDSNPLLFVVNEEEKQSAQATYPDAKVINSGNPCWEDFCHPKYTREEIRRTLEIPDDRIMILSPGIKSPVVNVILWGTIAELLGREPAKGYSFVISPHPGDKTPIEVYGDIVEFGKARIVRKEMFSASAMLPGADIVIESASTIGIEAAHLRKPVIDLFSEIALERLKKATGSKTWGLCEMGCSCACSMADVGMLSILICHLLSRTPGDNLCRRQELSFPFLERGQASKKVAEALKQFVS